MIAFGIGFAVGVAGTLAVRRWVVPAIKKLRDARFIGG